MVRNRRVVKKMRYNETRQIFSFLKPKLEKKKLANIAKQPIVKDLKKQEKHNYIEVSSKASQASFSTFHSIPTVIGEYKSTARSFYRLCICLFRVLFTCFWNLRVF